MLVRFLSFAASVIGTRRYRPILISLAAVLLSTASIAAVTSVLDDQPRQAASASQQSDTKTDQQTTSGLDDLDKQTPRDESAAVQTPQAQPQGATSDNTKPTTNNGTQANAAPELLLSASSVTLSANSTTSLVQLSMSDKSTATWTVASDNLDSGVATTLESTNGAAITLRLKLEQNATPGTYQLTISAKDAARSLDLSKKITVIVAN